MQAAWAEQSIPQAKDHRRTDEKENGNRDSGQRDGKDDDTWSLNTLNENGNAFGRTIKTELSLSLEQISQTNSIAQVDSTSRAPADVWVIDWFRRYQDGIEIRYVDGWSEIIRKDEYILIDNRSRVVIRRPATTRDRLRLDPLSGN